MKGYIPYIVSVVTGIIIGVLLFIIFQGEQKERIVTHTTIDTVRTPAETLRVTKTRSVKDSSSLRIIDSLRSLAKENSDMIDTLASYLIPFNAKGDGEHYTYDITADPMERSFDMIITAFPQVIGTTFTDTIPPAIKPNEEWYIYTFIGALITFLLTKVL